MKDLPKLKDCIAYKTSDENNWTIGKVISRGGKVGGVHWHYLNVKPMGTDGISSLSFRDDVKQWRSALDTEYSGNSSHESEDEVETPEFVYIGKHVNSDKFVAAKNEELLKWKQMKVFTEVEDTGQSVVSTTWVCTEKLKGGSLVCKARLVARGFEENSSNLTKKSPTCTKDSFRLALLLANIGKSMLLTSKALFYKECLCLERFI